MTELTEAELQARYDLYSINSIGKLIDHGYRVALYCENPRDGLTCNFVKWLDLEKLAAKLGRNHGCLASDITPHLWCTKCGGKKVSVRLHPPTGPHDYSESSIAQQQAAAHQPHTSPREPDSAPAGHDRTPTSRRVLK